MDYLQYTVIGALKADSMDGFKPYYKWITFNTNKLWDMGCSDSKVLNLIINGLPSIHLAEL